ncbi:MAG TPA: hypothetical protein VEU28_03565 [Actinomycetota bacterium]|nr:hypothetical protein [Actinomycetota bacterium]
MADDDFQASPGSPRIYELIQDAPGKNNQNRVGGDNSVWAWPEVTDFLKIAGQPVPGPWPPHQEARPDPEVGSAVPEAVAEPAQEERDIARKRGDDPNAPLTYRRGGGAAQEEARPTTDAQAERLGFRDLDAFEKARTTGVVWKGGSLKDLNPGE